MANLIGIVINLRTKNQSGAGTDDHLYLGIVGSAGGREFPLDVRRFDDFEKGSDVRYWFGTVWEGAALVGARKPYQSEPGERNDPAWFRVDMDEVQHVYLKKQGDNTTKGDDAWKLDFVEVALYGESTKRTFSTGNDLWFGNEYGRKAWLPEVLRGSSLPVATVITQRRAAEL